MDASTDGSTDANPDVTTDGSTDSGSDSSSDAGDAGSACAALGRNCHVVSEPDGGPNAACHTLGHGSNENACQAQLATCTTLCGTAACELLKDLCHTDASSGPIHECHELGHSGNAANCFARARECYDLCRGDGGTGDGGH
jgi:hypothetical protein